MFHGVLFIFQKYISSFVLSGLLAGSLLAIETKKKVSSPSQRGKKVSSPFLIDAEAAAAVQSR